MLGRLQAALRAKAAGSTRFCMGAAWRGPSQVSRQPAVLARWGWHVGSSARLVRQAAAQHVRITLPLSWLTCPSVCRCPCQVGKGQWERVLEMVG